MGREGQNKERHRMWRKLGEEKRRKRENKGGRNIEKQRQKGNIKEEGREK